MRLSIIIPLLNEQDTLRELYERLVAVAGRAGMELQIIFVDDGSTDDSPLVIRELAAADPAVMGIRLSRNFGHEAASTAGLDVATGDAVVLIDADLQDPPEVIEEMLARWREGYQIIYAQRRHRVGESAFKKTTSWLFYRVLNWLSDIEIPMDVGDFRLIDRKVLEGLRQCRETDRFVRGLVAWTGFKSTAVQYDRPARKAGRTKYRPLKLLILSIDAAVGFSTTPLRVATWLGFLVTLVSLEEAVRIAVQKLIWGYQKMPGFALQTVGLFFLGGVQMLLLGIIGEYIGRIYRQVQSRPLYLVAERMGKVGEGERGGAGEGETEKR